MSMFNVGRDQQFARMVADDVEKSQGHLALCGRCEGTGNELYAMYRKCSDCDGVGAIELVGEATNE